MSLEWVRRAAASAGLSLAVVAAGCLLTPFPDRHGLEALEEGRPLLGAWLGAWPGDKRPVLDAFEDETGVRLDLVDIYLDWYTPWSNVSHAVWHTHVHGALPILTWEAHGFTTRDIVSGSNPVPLRDGRTLTLDTYLEEFARGACGAAEDDGMPVFLRVMHEMNGNWFSWGQSYELPDGTRPNSDGSYKEAWRKIHRAFESRCPGDVKFVWAVNHFSVGEGASFTGTYPGDAFVDFVGLDGYNWGTNAEWGWQAWPDIFHEAYCAVVRTTNRQVLINEVASTERGGDKAAWIRDMWARLDDYGRVRGVVWFNDAKHESEIGGRMDWPLDSSPGAMRAWEEGARALRTGAPAVRGDPC